VKPLVFPKHTKEQIQVIASDFEKVKGIPYVICAVDGSHVPIIAPNIDPASYYCRKGFYYVFL
jgi:hypothetical protein